MTDTTESAGLVKIADDLDIFVHDMREDGNDASALWLERRASALRRLAAQDQKPVAWRYRYEMKEGAWGKWTVQKNKPNWYSPDQADVEIEPLFASPPPAAAEIHASVDDYRNAIDEALVVRYLGVAKGNAKSELDQIISWEVDANLDPAVSSRAQALIDQGRNASAEARLRVIDECSDALGYQREYLRTLLSAHPPASDCAGQESRAKATEGKAGMAGGQAPVRRSTAGTGLRVGVADAVQPATSEIMDATAGRDRQPSEPRGCPTPGACSCLPVADVTVEDIALVLLDGWKAGEAPIQLASTLLGAFTVGKCLSDKQGER